MAESTIFMRRNWQVQRAGWALMALAVLLAVAGLFGQGPLSSRSASAPGLTLHYQRVVRLEAAQSLEFALDAPEAGDVALELDREFLTRTEIQRILPDPRTVSTSLAGQQLHFAAAGAGPIAVRVLYVPKRLGRLPARFGIPGAAPLSVSLLVLP